MPGQFVWFLVLDFDLGNSRYFASRSSRLRCVGPLGMSSWWLRTPSRLSSGYLGPLGLPKLIAAAVRTCSLGCVNVLLWDYSRRRMSIPEGRKERFLYWILKIVSTDDQSEMQESNTCGR